mgnify:CR=1 FL=1
MHDLTKNLISASTGAVCTVMFTHPIDFYKTRLQFGIKSNGFKSIYQTYGVTGFWTGIKPAILRESTYTTARIGLYEPVKKLFNIKPETNFALKFLAGSASGLIGSVIGNPFDVMKIQSMRKPEESFSQIIKHTYSNKLLYRGLQANLLRASVLNGTKMSCYDQIKNWIGQKKIFSSDLPVQFAAASCAGFCMACTATPFDVIRTKLMAQSAAAKTNFFTCVKDIVKELGLSGLYTGFIPIWLRFAPTTCLQLVIYEQTKKLL